MFAKVTRFVACWKGKIAFCTILFILSLLAAGCGAIDTSITFYPSEEWKAESRVTLNPQETAQFGSTAEAELSKQAAKWKAQNVRYDWRKEKDDVNTVYVVTMEGKGLPLLNETLFSNKATIEKTDNGIHLSYYEQGLIGARASTLRLTGGKIVSSNADEVKGNTAIWYNVKSGDQVDIVLTEASKSPIPCIGGFAFFAPLLVFGVYMTCRKRGAQMSHG